MSRHKQSEQTRLRKFALVMSVALGLLGAFLWWRARPAWPYVAGAGGVFLLLGLVAPKLLAPIERAWMALANVLQAIVTRILVTLTFFLAITPIGLTMRLLGKDPLDKAPDPEATTYWVVVDPRGPGSRPNKPF